MLERWFRKKVKKENVGATRQMLPPTVQILPSPERVARVEMVSTDEEQAQRRQAESRGELELGTEYTVDGQRAKDFLGPTEVTPEEVFDAWGGTIRHLPKEMERDGYVLLFGNLLGAGTFGTVMEATRKPGSTAPEEVRASLPKSENIVMKFIIINPESDRYERDITMVYRELAALSQNHMLYDAYQLQTEGVDDTVVVVIEMKKLEGPNAYAYIEDLKESADRYSSEKRLEMMKMFRSCLVQLRVLAKRGWQHRDVKPANILVNHGNARIADFGLARRVDDTTGKRHSTGTPVYMTPRTIESKKDPFADLYALGLIAGEEMGYIKRERFPNVPQILMAIPRGGLWKKTEQPEALAAHTDAERLFMQLIEEMVQLGADKDEYHNTFGTDEFSKKNMVETITAVLRRAHEIIKQQESEIAAMSQQQKAA